MFEQGFEVSLFQKPGHVRFPPRATAKAKAARGWEGQEGV